MIFTDVGEVGIETGAAVYRLRPSLYAMSQIGTPAEIVRVFASVSADFDHPEKLCDALAVINACADTDVTHIFGHFDSSGVVKQFIRGYRFGHYAEMPAVPQHVPGAAPAEDAMVIAAHLMRHGITGIQKPLPPKPNQEPDYVREFHALQHVSLAMAHLGLSSAEAWQLTMTELVGALRAKFPPEQSNTPGSRAPSKEQHEKTMAWFEGVQAARMKKDK